MPDPQMFRFGEFELDLRLRELRRDGEAVRLQPRPFALLVYLLEHADRVVPADELLKAVWPGLHVEEGAIKTAVRVLRRTLRDSADRPRWIENVRGMGYRFRGERTRVESRAHGGAADAPARLSGEREATQAGRPAPGSGDFVGRQSLLLQMSAMLEGPARVLLLHGPPGVGKTNTALHFAREARARGYGTHVGRTHDGEGVPAFWPWIGVLRSWFAAHDADEQQSARRAFPGLGVLLPDPGSPEAAPESGAFQSSQRGRFLMFDEIARFLCAASARQPLLLILDDLHWADEDSLALLLFLARHASGMRGLILGTHRDGAEARSASRWLSDVRLEHGTESLGLGGLPREAVERMLRAQVGPDVSPDVCERVFAATGGNPLFVLELARSLSSRSRTPGEPLEPISIPQHLRDAVAARLRGSSPDCQRVLRAMSAEPSGLSLAVIRRVVELSGADLLAALAEAERAGYVRGAEEQYQFSHDLVREIVYGGMDAKERGRVHCALGEALQAIGGADPLELLGRTAHHFTRSAAVAQPERALDYATRAAEAARAMYAFSDAASLYRRALSALDFIDRPTPEQRCGLLLALGEMLGESCAPFEELQDAFLRAMDLAQANDLSDLWARAAARCVYHLAARGAFAMGLQVGFDPVARRIQASLRAVLPEVEGEIQAEVLLALGTLSMVGGQSAAVPELIERLSEIGRTHPNSSLRGEILVARWIVDLLDRDELEGLPAVLRECAQEFERPLLESASYSAELYFALERGDRELVDRAGRQIERVADQGLLSVRVPARSWHLLEKTLAGDLQGAQQVALEAGRLAAQENWPERSVEAMNQLLGWWAIQLHGEIDSVLDTVSQAFMAQPHRPIQRLFLARLYAQCGLADFVRPELDGLRENLQVTAAGVERVYLIALAAECCALVRDRDRAKFLFEMLEPYADRLLLCGWLLCGGIAARPLGSLAALLGDWDRSESLFERALAHARRLQSPVVLATVELDHAAALLERGRPSDRSLSEARIRSAAEAAEALSLGGLLERAGVLSERRAGL